MDPSPFPRQTFIDVHAITVVESTPKGDTETLLSFYVPGRAGPLDLRCTLDAANTILKKFLAIRTDPSNPCFLEMDKEGSVKFIPTRPFEA